MELVGVFANAGVGGVNVYSTDAKADRWDDILRINVTGVYVTLMTARPHLMAARIGGACRGHLQHVARFGCPHNPAYVTSKTAVLGLAICSTD